MRSPDANLLRAEAAEVPLAEAADGPIRLTANTAPRDPFAAQDDDVPADEPSAEEATMDDGSATDEVVKADATDAEATESVDDDLAVDDTMDVPDADDAQLADDRDNEGAEDEAPVDELSDGPMMVDPEADDGLSQFAQRSTDEAPSDEPLPAEVQDEQFPPRMDEPGDEAYGDVTMPERCPSPRDLKPINQITHRIAAEPGLFPQECVLSDEPFQPRNFSCVAFTWKASALCHKPLYFQQAKLERYGHTFGPVLTPIISGGHFFVSVIALPYKIGMNPPWECMYPLGWYRPSSCAPYTLGPVPISLRGAALQGVVTTGLWFLFP